MSKLFFRRIRHYLGRRFIAGGAFRTYNLALKVSGHPLAHASQRYGGRFEYPTAPVRSYALTLLPGANALEGKTYIAMSPIHRLESSLRPCIVSSLEVYQQLPGLCSKTAMESL